MAARFCTERKDWRLAIEFLIMSRATDEAFEVRAASAPSAAKALRWRGAALAVPPGLVLVSRQPTHAPLLSARA